MRPPSWQALVKSEPRICSTRFHLHRGNTCYFASFAEPGVRALWKKAVDLGLVVELDLGPNYAREPADAIARLSRLQGADRPYVQSQDGHDLGIWRCAGPGQVSQRLHEDVGHGLYAPTTGRTIESLIPFTRRVIKEFGPDRMVWSGDSPHIADVHMKGYSAADIAKVKGGNLQRLLNW